MYEEVRELTREAKSKGLVVVLWSYARGEQLSKEARRPSTPSRTARTWRASSARTSSR
jgi:DhnA family fructose-bisphosphate aldolase class Ia